MRTIWARQALLPEGWAEGVVVAIDAAGRIAAVARAPAAPKGAETRAILLPAVANLHSHAFQRAMAGLTERRGPDPRDSFWTWRHLMFRFLDQLTPDDIEAITAFAQLEMLRAGFASVAEFHYLHHGPGGVPYADPAETSARIEARTSASVSAPSSPALSPRIGAPPSPCPLTAPTACGCDRPRRCRSRRSARIRPC